MANDVDRDTAFLGRGWAFPPRFDAQSGKVEMASADEDIIQSLTILFLTRPGERVLHPDYGSALQDLVFEPMNGETTAAIRHAIERAVLFFEPRISLERVKVEPRDWPGGYLTITLSYRIKTTNTRSNVVFPFYLTEGTLLSDTPSVVL